jgi:hypothetical protein
MDLLSKIIYSFKEGLRIILEALRRELLSWDGVTEHVHRFGGVEFRYQNKELGHLHGEKHADFLFPKSIRNELVAFGVAEPHPVVPDSGVSFWIKGEQDLPRLIKLFRMQYDRLAQKNNKS